jgi:hypothetical protein
MTCEIQPEYQSGLEGVIVRLSELKSVRFDRFRPYAVS